MPNAALVGCKYILWLAQMTINRLMRLIQSLLPLFTFRLNPQRKDTPTSRPADSGSDSSEGVRYVPWGIREHCEEREEK